LLPRAEETVARSVELGKELNNPRHTAIALLTASLIAEKAGDLAVAEARMLELIEINERLGLTAQVAKSEQRVVALRTRSTRRGRLGPG
jgi:hypothetical protein